MSTKLAQIEKGDENFADFEIKWRGGGACFDLTDKCNESLFAEKNDKLEYLKNPWA